MEYGLPPFFKRGPSPLARLSLFIALSVLLLVTDARYRYLDALRDGASLALYPLQRIATAPGAVYHRVQDFFVTQSQLAQENARLRQEQLRMSARLQRLEALEAENAHLRALLKARDQHAQKAVAAEILYAERNPFSRKILVDKGSIHDVVAGQVVIDAAGVVGQVTRVYPLLSEVTLITDKDHAVPVQVVRTGFRAIVFGSEDGALELRYLPLSADIETGDLLVTSGIDSVYPAGLPVARVTKIERDAGQSFARIVCQPVAGVAQHRQVLILTREEAVPARPAEAPAESPKAARKER
ncbi:rod shape-determining protein MreC [Pelomicrobium methylotrophicum]|uniref:Cell shape-determining protein MreC n=1 Tax=Pelomicrobium methylotrophicum TaxID=2602750 RepID=A0A5C7EN41_9PROT|nr:rod shape-determining protein MreC [Pelomicrobium methylotrophicum]TXF12668.1 rod shape-determining protein MreC [Pelomicrobium methylotrophicum]